MRYEAWSEGPCSGLKCTDEVDGAVTYVYLNPSATETGEEPTVFLYIGATGDPADDMPQHWYGLDSGANREIA